ncbi:hypothetical protein Poli38472_008179 [Pythium oligandrum]|uniref:Uncharacterized protein n=1 Tax=Pythium oligandrum TaxID=41045 RepID=A0A8K1FN60_PYTOL|nr:hypothetical protein Poli38472_008179 [Pythium oligandrum]|eukprot:TMW65537.1 hypothetical protein Poli38472_008179 [Pythium oligandrum]
METPAVRVLVVGDSGVGKTTLLQGVCTSAANGVERESAKQAHRWTIGCDVHLLLHHYRDGYGMTKETYIEFVDVGGHPKYEISRAMFYHDVQGIILMHDLSNARSFDHLRQWMTEIQETQRRKGSVLSASFHQRTADAPTLHSLPKLIIGNKRDLVARQSSNKRLPTTVASELRGIDTLEASAEPFALDQYAFGGFLDRVVAFANNQGVESSQGHDATYHPASAFSDGLRQMKGKPGVSPSPTALNSTGSWWR